MEGRTEGRKGWKVRREGSEGREVRERRDGRKGKREGGRGSYVSPPIACPLMLLR